jgi:carbon storage regulator
MAARIRLDLKVTRRMLVFTRKKDESLIIGNDIEVTILSVGASSVKVGIRAPRNISVHRSEVYEAIKQENLAAARSSIPPPNLFKKLLRP